jgi:lipopolysaccharide export system permease protein
MKKTTYLYILKETLPIFFIGLMVFTIILLMDKILKMIELIVTRGVSFHQILMLLLFISPSFLTFTIPMAVLLGILLAFGRLSGDSEITAFKASGMSLYQLFIPISIFSICAYLLTTLLVFYGLPWGNRGFKATLYLIAQSKADIEIKERVFNDMFDGLVVYVDKVPIQGKKMEGILIYDEREQGKSTTVFANEGFLSNNPKSQEIILRLLNGDIHRVERQNNVYQKVQFQTYDVKLELAKAFTAIGKKLKDREMSIDDIKEKMEEQRRRGAETTSLEIQLHKRYAFPFACIVFGLIGVPLGIQPRRSGRSYGFVFSLLIILAYYISLTTFEILTLRLKLPAFLAGWAPNLLFGSLGIYLLIKAANETPFKLSIWLVEGMDAIQRKWKRLFEDV